MQMKRVRLTLVLALLALAAFGWRAAVAGSSSPNVPRIVQQPITTSDPGGGGADPDTPQVTKRLTRAPDSDGGRSFSREWPHYLWIGRVMVSVYLGRWFAR
jgi:hypothetical protein